jgi:hypothetical protein
MICLPFRHRYFIRRAAMQTLQQFASVLAPRALCAGADMCALTRTSGAATGVSRTIARRVARIS